MRVLIIGGTAFVGPFVARQLHAQGHRVTLFHRGRTAADLPAGVAHLHGDRARLADHAAAFRHLAPDVVLDMFPATEAMASAVVAAFGGLAGRLVAISSIDVYRAYDRLRGADPGPPDPVPLTEKSPLRERLFPYRDGPPPLADDPLGRGTDYDKLPVEQAVLGAPGLPGTILRLPMVYGPGDYQHRLFPYLKRMDDGRPAILLDARRAGWRGARGYAENVAAAIALAVVDGRAAGRVYNVAEPDTLTERDWVRQIGEAADWRGAIVALPPDQLPPTLRMGDDPAQDWVVSSARIRRELGYAEPVPRDTGLRRAVAWVRAHPPARYDPAAFDYAAEDAALAAAPPQGD